MGLLFHCWTILYFIISTSDASAAFAMTSADSNSNNSNSNNNQGGKVGEANNKNSEIPQLPPPDPNSDLPTIKLGETIKFEEWGPIILNTDGSTRKIANWDSLSENEKQVTWRRISKRNEERRQALLKQQYEEEEATNDVESEKEL